MVLLYPLALVAAIWSKKRTTVSRGGWDWFAAWTLNPDAGRAWLFAGLVLGLGAVAAYRAAPGDRA